MAEFLFVINQKKQIEIQSRVSSARGMPNHNEFSTMEQVLLEKRQHDLFFWIESDKTLWKRNILCILLVQPIKFEKKFLRLRINFGSNLKVTDVPISVGWLIALQVEAVDLGTVRYNEIKKNIFSKKN